LRRGDEDMIVDFYHLTASPLERVLPSIAEKVLAGGERLLVVAEAGLLARLDEQMWSYAKDSFLPHGRDRAESQPVLLSAEPRAANGATNIVLADGTWRDDALAFARAFYFFDNDGREAARTAWRALKDKPEVEARYWKQDERGKWVQGP
jgi:DNA polymerase III subunit chi